MYILPRLLLTEYLYNIPSKFGILSRSVSPLRPTTTQQEGERGPRCNQTLSSSMSKV